MKVSLIDIFRNYYINTEFKETENCISEDLLFKYVFSLIDDENMIQNIEKHLAECPFCVKRVIEINNAKMFDEIDIKEDELLTEKIYEILKSFSLPLENFIILEVVKQKTKNFLRRIKESKIFQAMLPELKLPSYSSAKMFSMIALPETTEMLYSTKIGEIDIKFRISLISSSEIKIYFEFMKNKTPVENVEVKIDDLILKSSKNGSVSTSLQVKNYKITITPADPSLNSLSFDLLLNM